MYLVFSLLVLVVTARAGVVPAIYQAKLQVRLQNHLTSYGSRPGSRFQCKVLSPLVVEDRVLIPRGSLVHGTVRRALSVHLGLLRERAALELAFSDYTTPAGQTLPLGAKLVSIDNAREEVTPKGQIKGVLAATNPNEVLNGIWKTPSWAMFYRPMMGLTGLGQEFLERFPMGPIGPALLLSVRFFILRFPEPEIHLPPGTDMELQVDMAASSFVDEPSVPVLEAPPGLAQWLSDQPTQIDRPNGKRVEDVVNLAFVGSREELANAFEASGWYAAAPTTFSSFSRTYIAFNGKKNYAFAPVSKLLYRGREPDLVFEKSLDTVTKRHHVRIWNAGTFDNESIWLGAATHDTAMIFDPKKLFFSHRIDKNVDAEREKIAVDLTFSDCSEPVLFSQAAAKPDSTIFTDGRIAVVPLQACSALEYPDAEPDPLPPGNKATRLIRRIVLESRSYILRENAYYWAYQAIRYRTAKD